MADANPFQELFNGLIDQLLNGAGSVTMIASKPRPLDMEAEFLSIVNAARHDKIETLDKLVNHKTRKRDFFPDHVFDFGDAIVPTTAANAGHPELPSSINAPFAAFWMLYRTSNGLAGHIINALHVEIPGDGLVDYAFQFFCRHDHPTLKSGWKQHPSVIVRDGVFHCSSPEKKWNEHKPTASEEYLPEFLQGLELLKRRKFVPVDPSPLYVAANAGRAKSKKRALAPLRPMIRVTGIVREPYNDGFGVGTGTERAPHDRRGHQRVLASGRVVQVRACRIKGGATSQQTYQVAA